MPDLVFEDDEEPGGHVTQHEEQLPPPDPLSHGNLRWVLHFIITSARNHKMHDSGK